MSTLKWVGAVLVTVGVVGFLTVADDLRHTGEILGVGLILTAGLLLLSVSLFPRQKK